MEEEEGKEEAEYIMVSTISFIQANLQHSIAASRILTRTVGVKELIWHCYRSRGIVGAVSGA